MDQLHTLTDLSFPFILILIILLWLFYYLFWKPYDSFQDFSNYGFNSINSTNYDSTIKRSMINNVLNQRKQGDIPPPYPNGWFGILESGQLGRKKVKEVTAFGLNLVAWRGQSGQCYVADAYCPHLGAHLGVGGQVSGECITCPFHGWEYQGDGALFKIPYSDSKPDLKIKMWEVKEQDGMIYLWYDDLEGHPLSQSQWSLPLPVKEIQSGHWRFRGRVEFQVACHIQDIFENGADSNHNEFVHYPALLGGNLKFVAGGSFKPNEVAHLGDITLTGHFEILQRFRLLHMTFNITQVGSGILKLDLSMVNATVLIHVTPVGPLLQRLTIHFYSSPLFIHPLGKLALIIFKYLTIPDVEIFNRKTFVRSPPLPKEDGGIKLFRQWYSRFYSKDKNNKEGHSHSTKYFTRQSQLEF